MKYICVCLLSHYENQTNSIHCNSSFYSTSYQVKQTWGISPCMWWSENMGGENKTRCIKRSTSRSLSGLWDQRFVIVTKKVQPLEGPGVWVATSAHAPEKNCTETSQVSFLSYLICAKNPSRIQDCSDLPVMIVSSSKTPTTRPITKAMSQQVSPASRHRALVKEPLLGCGGTDSSRHMSGYTSTLCKLFNRRPWWKPGPVAARKGCMLGSELSYPWSPTAGGENQSHLGKLTSSPHWPKTGILMLAWFIHY